MYQIFLLHLFYALGLYFLLDEIQYLFQFNTRTTASFDQLVKFNNDPDYEFDDDEPEDILKAALHSYGEVIWICLAIYKIRPMYLFAFLAYSILMMIVGHRTAKTIQLKDYKYHTFLNTIIIICIIAFIFWVEYSVIWLS
jgi:hypothetical protein